MFDCEKRAALPMRAALPVMVLVASAIGLGLSGTLQANPPTSQPAKTAAKAEDAAKPADVIAKMQEEAAGIRPLFPAAIVQKFLDAVKELPAVEPRTLIYNRDAKKARLIPNGPAPTTQPGERIIELPAEYYYTTRYGTPLAYARPLQILAESGFKSLAGARMLDFGYGTIGHLRLWASCGADVVGVEVDPTTEALYSRPDDIGVIKGVAGAPNGKIALTTGKWPADANTREVVKDGFDVIISKNVLKRGYVHPSQPVDKRMMVELGVPDAAYVAAIFDALKPGGRFMIYNICPAPNPPDKPYIPWSDGRCPFERKMLEDRGFQVLAFDQDDSENVRVMARALGWAKGESPMDVEHDLFAHYTLMIKPLPK